MPTTIDSSLLYVGDDGRQHFAHDSYRDFFLAKRLARSINQGVLSPREVYNKLKDGSSLGFFYKKLSADSISDEFPLGESVEIEGVGNSVLAGSAGKISFVHPAYRNVLAAKHISESGYLIERLLPFLVGLSEHGPEFIRLLLQENPNPLLLATCYVNSKTKDKTLEESIVETAIMTLEELCKDEYQQSIAIVARRLFGREDEYQQSIAATRLLRSSYFLERCDGLFAHEKGAIREATALILGGYDYDEISGIIKRHLKSPDWRVRWNSLECLTHFHNPDSINEIINACSDENPLVVYKALFSLYEVCGENSKDVLPCVRSRVKIPTLRRFAEELFMGRGSYKDRLSRGILSCINLRNRLRNDLKKGPRDYKSSLLLLILLKHEEYGDLDEERQNILQYNGSVNEAGGRLKAQDILDAIKEVYHSFRCG